MENTKLNKEKKLNPPIGLIEKYQYLISKIAGQFNNISESKENLEEVGYIGLLNAANLYDKEVHQIDFQTFAQLLITEEMHQYLINKNRQVDRPDWLVNLNHRIDSYVIEYQEKYGRFPQISEISEYLNINTFGLQEILKARDSLLENYSLKQKEQKIDFTQIQPDLGKIKSQSYQSFKLPIEDLIALQRALKKLKKLSEGIIYYLFIMDLSQTRLAKIMGISPQQANQLKKEAYNQLK
ncbi:MAG: sigma-70 family RNA polymerase sigma factor [Atribacterota bacterium]|jgi:RNA polymerase sigma-B factor|nr:sigma-70 family RNA polymerase sigma factor [Atribacterota bacterium]MDD3640791.1 sigma-70 family RNA polymerase sigma factor [Atribacterota bacterium]MDI9597072.1 sigma-70 family RNA polymerase sigma factor [Atribacterota bacterium]